MLLPPSPVWFSCDTGEGHFSVKNLTKQGSQVTVQNATPGMLLLVLGTELSCCRDLEWLWML